MGNPLSRGVWVTPPSGTSPTLAPATTMGRRQDDKAAADTGLQVVEDLPLTEECHHYAHVDEVPWDIQKYWHQRYSIFTQYDADVRLTDDAWFGVTPEPVATKIAQELTSLVPTTSRASPEAPAEGEAEVIDLFAGAGGNAIAFALSGRWAHVVAVERDAAVLACAQHNARAYGVPAGAVTWVLGDCFDFVDRLHRYRRRARQRHRRQGRRQGESPSPWGDQDQNQDQDQDEDQDKDKDKNEPALASTLERLATSSTPPVLFASPPWGGVNYAAHDVYDLSAMTPYDLAALHGACRPLAHALYLPRTSDLRQIAALAGGGGHKKTNEKKKKIEVVQYCMEGASKALVAYIPAAAEEWGEEVEQQPRPRSRSRRA